MASPPVRAGRLRTSALWFRGEGRRHLAETIRHLFEAAASGVPVISDRWPGVEGYFVVGREMMLASTPAEVVRLVTTTSPDRRAEIAREARARVLAEHTADHRAEVLEHLVELVRSSIGRRR